MLAKYSVKKPFTVLVGAIIVLMLGAVALHFMKTDLLPEFEVPYLMIITSDAGAAPEQVESEVTELIEGAVGSLSGVTSVQSISAIGYSTVVVEFSDNTDMDGALVETSAAVNEVAAELPDDAGSPYYLQVSLDMIAMMYLGVISDEDDVAQLTQTVDDEIVPALERLEGVANVSSVGLVTDSVDVRLNQDKIDNVNDGILGVTNEKLADAADKLDDAQDKIDKAATKLDRSERKLKRAKRKLAKQQKEVLSGFDKAQNGLNEALVGKSVLLAQLSTLQAQLSTLETNYQTLVDVGAETTQQGVELKSQIDTVSSQISAVQEKVDTIETALKKSGKLTSSELSAVLGFSEGTNQIDDALSQVKSGRQQLKKSRKKLKVARKKYDRSRKSAIKRANIDTLVDKTTLAQLIAAQDFEMPAGYVSGSNDKQWLVKVGQSYDSVFELKNTVLTHIDDLGDIRLKDVSDVNTSNNLGTSYAVLDGQDGIILSVVKMSTANTGEVSDALREQVDKLNADTDGTEIISIYDQGDYIDLYIWTVLKSLIIGAALAVVVLGAFLKNVRPTLVVAFSIPFSVLFALVIMYFFGLTINIMTLGALSVSIGMLVDNSIVVMENIYRMRSRGMTATRAAAQGALQVTGAITASTITSICVFFPFVFASGTVRQLMVPFALTISIALLASLIVALTVVPSISAAAFKRRVPTEVTWFSHLQDAYARALQGVLDHKVPVIVAAVVLLVVAVALVVNMGIVMLPQMNSNQIMLTLEMPSKMDREDANSIADVASGRLNKLDGVSNVGVADGGTTLSTMMGSALNSDDLYTGTFIVYLTLDADKVNTDDGVRDLKARAIEALWDLDCEVSDSDDMSSMSSFFGSDATVEITGTDRDQVITTSEDVMDAMQSIDGYEEIENGQEEAARTLHVIIDRDKVARMGTTVAQIYTEISDQIDEDQKAFELIYHGHDSDVNVYSAQGQINKSDVKNLTFSDSEGKEHAITEVATIKTERGIAQIERTDMVYSAEVTAEVAEGKNITLLARELEPKLAAIDTVGDVEISIEGTNADIYDMLRQMALLLVLGFILVYLVMVAQFQSLLLPFIIIFTVPLAFTGSMFALVAAGEQISMMALLGFVILMGTVVNNGIVFIDYVNQMRLGGMAKRAALIATGRTRLRPIIMTALTTIIAMSAMIVSNEIGSSMERGMALVVVGGLTYATFMTLLFVPVVYDIFCRKPLVKVDIGSDVDDEASDAHFFIAQMGEDARESYTYESRHARRKRIRAARRAEKRKKAQRQIGRHSELCHLDDEDEKK